MQVRHNSKQERLIRNSFFTLDDSPLARLRWSWLRLAISWLVIWLIGYRLLQGVWPYANRWLALSGVVLAYCLWVLWRHLRDNHRAGEERLLPQLGPGNRLTMLRGLCIGLLAGFLFSPWPLGGLAWVLVLLYTLIDVADYLDGYLARRANHSTALGGVLDMEFDGLGLAVVSLLAVGYGQLPWWYLSIGAARYLFVWGVWWRQRRGRPVFDAPSSVHRRIVAGVQMGLMSVVLWPIVPAGPLRIAAALVAVPTLLSFLRDWLIVSGRLSADNPIYNRLRRFSYRLMTQWLPPVLRLLLVIAMLAIYRSMANWLQPEAWVAILETWRVPATAVLATLLSLTALLGTGLVALGAAGRLVGVALFFPLGFDGVAHGLTWANGLAVACTMLIVLFGTGPYSLWQPEETYFVQRAGAADHGDGGLAQAHG